MARIPIFDSEAAVGSDGEPVTMTLVGNQQVHSVKFRCFADRDIRNLSYEFLLTGAGSATWNFTWYQEFYNDEPWPLGSSPVGLPYPTERTFPGATAGLPWSREQTEEAGGAGAIAHYNVTRTISLVEPADSRHFPMLIQSLWTRLAITPTTVEAAYPRLRVWVLIAGHPQEKYLETLALPFRYNVGM